MNRAVKSSPPAGEPSESQTDEGRRSFLYTLTGAMAAFGVASFTIPMIRHMSPAADVDKMRGVKVDLSQIPEGRQTLVKWYGRPVMIRHRTADEINQARADDEAHLPNPVEDPDRLVGGVDGLKDRRFLVVIGVCPREYCVLTSHAGRYDGWYCPCCGANYDLTGRFRRGLYPLNLEVPPYRYTSASTLELLHPKQERIDRALERF